MTIHRNPVVAPPGLEAVVDSNPVRLLHCRDFDEHGKDRGPGFRECRDNLANNPDKRLVDCPNKGNSDGKCQTGAFLYPRRLRLDGTTHHHQGIDISPFYNNKPGNFRFGSDFESDPDGIAKPRAQIRSVVAGRVAADGSEPSKSYGIRIVIEADEVPEAIAAEIKRVRPSKPNENLKLFYIYAHCHASRVTNGQVVVEQEVIGGQDPGRRARRGVRSRPRATR